MFAPIEVLTVPARLELAALVAVPGRVPAVLPDELARSPLPADPVARAAVGAVIEAGLDPAAVSRLRELRLDTVVPALRRCDDEVLARFLPEPVLKRIARHLPTTNVAELTVGAIAACPGIGGRAVVSLVAATVAAGLDVTATAEPAGLTVDDVATVLAYDASGGGALARRARGAGHQRATGGARGRRADADLIAGRRRLAPHLPGTGVGCRRRRP